MRPIPPSDLVALDTFEGAHPVRVDLVYAQPSHKDNMFRCGIYREDARMWGHRDLAAIVLRAAAICFERSKYIFELKDCLRTTNAQQRMLDTDVCKANPQWFDEPRLLSPPGKGGHPRGMAVDIILIDENGEEADMGTPFDHLAPDFRVYNPAARNATDFSPAVLANRQLLEDCMMQAAQEAGRLLLPLPQEWWDFRFPNDYSTQFAPIADEDLPREMRMTRGLSP